VGDTLTTMTSTTSGFRYVMCARIEGHDAVLTSGSAAETITAFAATDWTAATAGLSWDGALSQDLAPWKAEITAGHARLVMSGPGAETIARLALRMASTDATTESRLTTAIDNNDTSITVESGTPFTAPGTAYVGGERFTYGVRISDVMSTVVRGLYHPCNRDGSTSNEFGRNHRLSNLGNGVTLPPKVTTTCNEWRGKWVVITCHQRLSETVIDTLAEAQVMFAGRIADLYDTSNGETVVEAEDLRAEIRDKILMERQFTGKVQEGCFLPVGYQFTATDTKYDGASAIGIADPLVVVSGAPADAMQIQTGFVTLDDLLLALNAWLNEALLVDTDLYATSYFELVPTEQGTRVALHTNYSGIGAVTNVRTQIGLPPSVGIFMGVLPTADLNYIVETSGLSGADLTATATNPPYRLIVGQVQEQVGSPHEIATQEYAGDFIDQTSTLPTALSPLVTTTGETWGIIDVGGKRFVARYDGSGAFSQVTPTSLLDTAGFRLNTIGILYDDDGEIIVKQVVMLEGGPTSLICALLASTGTAAYNHATHDRLDVQLGCGIPWSNLGTAFEESLQAMEDASNAGTAFIRIDKPTKLTDKIQAELLPRLAQFVWKNGTLQVTTWQTASALLSLHSLTGSTKASPIRDDPQRAPTRMSAEHMANVVKIESNAKPDGGYEHTTTITDQASVTSYGSKPITISLANTVSGEFGLGHHVDEIVQDLLVRLPLLSRPLWMHRRTVNCNHWENIAPGDICTVTDAYARNPKTGLRGLSGAPGIIFHHSRNMATGNAEVIIALNPEDRTGTYCPAMEVDVTVTSGAFTDGYDSAGSKLKVQANRHSYSTDPITTDVGYFVATDEVTIVQIDPPTAASPRSWDRTITAKSTNEITFSGGTLTGYDGATEKYRIISRYYTTATATQKVDTYQADDADELIQNAAAPYQYAIAGLPPNFDTTTVTSDPTTDLYSRHATLAFGDGAPLDVAYEDDLIRAHNSFIHVKSAVIRPCISEQVVVSGTGAGWFFLDEIPLHLGPQKIAGMTRYLKIAPFCRIDTAGSADIRVRLTRAPAYGDTNNGVDVLSPYREVTFTVDSTTWGTEDEVTISIDPIPADGNVYLIVEGEETIEYRGMGYLQLGVGNT
jgi:hypothetical protein